MPANTYKTTYFPTMPEMLVPDINVLHKIIEAVEQRRKNAIKHSRSAFRFTDVNFNSVLGRKRIDYLVFARVLISHYLRINCNWTTNEVGALFQRDHTTVVHWGNVLHDAITSPSNKLSRCFHDVAHLFVTPPKDVNRAEFYKQTNMRVSRIPKKKSRKKEEENLQLAVSRYINLQYPNVLFTSDASGLKLPIGLASKWKAQRCQKWKIPDMIILQPKRSKTPNALLHLGLVLELKKSRDELYRKDGTMRQDAHILEQNKALQYLQSLGYHAQFVCGFDDAKIVIDWYLG